MGEPCCLRTTRIPIYTGLVVCSCRHVGIGHWLIMATMCLFMATMCLFMATMCLFMATMCLITATICILFKEFQRTYAEEMSINKNFQLFVLNCGLLFGGQNSVKEQIQYKPGWAKHRGLFRYKLICSKHRGLFTYKLVCSKHKGLFTYKLVCSKQRGLFTYKLVCSKHRGLIADFLHSCYWLFTDLLLLLLLLLNNLF